MVKHDVIVIGLGAMGSASVYQLAKYGLNVLGIDQFSPPHTYGSSHGETRITRQAIAEGKAYVPLVLRANEIWKEIEAETGRHLYTKTGILIMASNTSLHPNKFLDDTIVAANQYEIEHSELNANELKGQFPQFNIQGDEKGYFEDGAGFLYAEECIEAQLELSVKHGATINTHEKFLSYHQLSDGILVKTEKAEYLTEKLVLTVGPWVNEVLPDRYKDSIKIYRQVLYWFEIEGDIQKYQVGSFPVFNWEFNTAHENFIYGFPSLDGKSIKIATEQYSEETTADNVNRVVTEQEIDEMHATNIAPYLPDVSRTCARTESCLYSVAPDWRFLLDRHPDNQNIIIASPCSGHGFKHSAAIGEVITSLVLGVQPTIDISEFGFDNLTLANA
jgi:sarcosine oxidase